MTLDEQRRERRKDDCGQPGRTTSRVGRPTKSQDGRSFLPEFKDWVVEQNVKHGVLMKRLAERYGFTTAV